VAVLMIDEVSFLLLAQLFVGSVCLGMIFPSRIHAPSAGLYVIMAEDPFQLFERTGRPYSQTNRHSSLQALLPL